MSVPMAEFFSVFGRIGIMSFGGPAGQIALMHKVLVDEKKWLEEEQFLHALSFCMVLPGPEAMQLATYAGWLKKGVPGGLMAGLLFVLPGAALITLLSAIYLQAGETPLVSGLLFGLKAAVLAVVLEALLRVGRRALKTRQAHVTAYAAFAAIALLQLPFPLIVLAAAIAGAVLGSGGKPAIAAVKQESVNLVLHGLHVGAWLAAWLLPLAALWFALGRANVFAAEAMFFSKAAAVTFGGAYAVLAYVAQQAVEVHGWLKPDEMLTGLGLAETTPGPLILVLVFVGFLGGARLGGIGELSGGLTGAAVTLWFTFVPCFLWVFAGAPFMERLRGVRWLADALAFVTAAVVGVIANLALWFGLHVLFGAVADVQLGPLNLPVPDITSLDWRAALIAAVSIWLLLFRHWNLMLVLALAAAAGAILTLGGI